MIIDSSALLAVIFAEHEGEQFARLITEEPNCRISAASYLEAAIRLDGLLGRVDPRLDSFLELMEIFIEPVTPEQARVARIAYRRFGKGNHPARLNMGDCFSYALSKITGEPLLFKGDDFPRTDIEPAWMH